MLTRITRSIRPRSYTEGPSGYPLLGNLLEFKRDALGFLLNAARQHGDVVQLQLGPETVFLLAHPELVREVFLDRDALFTKGGRWETLKMLLGDGMLTSEGEAWKRKRRIVEPAFHRSQLSQLTGMMSRTTHTMIDAWSAQAERGESLDVCPWMMRLTLEIVVRALFSGDVSADVQQISDAFMTAQRYISRITWDPVAKLRSRLPSRRRQKFEAAVATLDGIVFRLLSERRHGDDRGDLLQMILDAGHGESERPLTERELRDEVLTLMIAGHETTANALAWTWHLLARWPGAARAIRAEARRVLGDRDKVNFEDVQRLSWTRNVIQEAMRLHPPLWFIPRSVERDTVLGGVRIPKGSMVLVSPYVLHHDPRFWDNPVGFDPDRFRERPQPYTYLPFGMGPRTCIGRSFALMEMTLVVALIVRAFDISGVSGHPIEPMPLLTLRPRYGVRINLKRATA